MAVFVYGVVRARHELGDPPPGVSEPAGRVRLTTSGPLAAVVSDVDDAAAARGLPAEDAEPYLDVLFAVLAAGPVLPARFPTVAAHDDEVRELLDADPEALAARLDEIDGQVEVRVDVVTDVDRAARELLAASAEARELAQLGRTGPDTMAYRLELGERIGAELDIRRASVSEVLAGTLGPLAEDFAHLGTSDATITRYVFMLDRRALPEFDDAVERLSEELDGGYEVEYVGPLPLFDFAGPAATGDGPHQAAPEGGSTWGSRGADSRWGW